MVYVEFEVGRSYRLRRDWEIRDEKTGTMKQMLKKGDLVKVRKVEKSMDQVFVEGVQLPISYFALQRGVDLV